MSQCFLVKLTPNSWGQPDRRWSQTAGWCRTLSTDCWDSFSLNAPRTSYTHLCRKQKIQYFTLLSVNMLAHLTAWTCTENCQQNVWQMELYPHCFISRCQSNHIKINTIWVSNLKIYPYVWWQCHDNINTSSGFSYHFSDFTVAHQHLSITTRYAIFVKTNY